MAAATQRVLDDLGERSFSPRSRVGDLSVAQQQVVEVVEARSLDARILVMDEPTAALADEEVDQLLALVRRLRDRGLAVLYISHRLREVFAVDPFPAGSVEIDGAERRLRSPRDGIAAGLGFLTEDRKSEGLALAQSVRDNTLLGLRSGARPRRRGNGANGETGAGRVGLVERLALSTELRARSLDQEVRFLSGGNQQKVVLAKWLALDPGVLLFDEPTRGIDVGAKAAIHELMRDLARQGSAVVMISSELPELIGLSDRIVVLHEGRIAAELPGGATEQQIIALAAGHQLDEIDPEQLEPAGGDDTGAGGAR